MNEQKKGKKKERKKEERKKESEIRKKRRKGKKRKKEKKERKKEFVFFIIFLAPSMSFQMSLPIPPLNLSPQPLPPQYSMWTFLKVSKFVSKL